jgi:aminoglycoside 6'-N-acetyltransferase
MSPVLHGTATTLRPVTPEDADALTAILGEPEVARWWPRYDAERVQRDLIEAQGTTVFVIEVDGEVVGSVQYVEEPAPDYRHASVDVFLNPKHHGRGLGSDAVRTLARHLVHDRGHHRLAIDPAADNVKAIKAYKRVGFREVGVMRRYERGPDGEWHDGMLMDLLASDLH